MLPDHFVPELAPKANEDAVIVADQVRFTVLTERLIRLEYDPSRVFNDRATQNMWYRDQPVPDFTVDQDDDWLTIETEAFVLQYKKGEALTRSSLSITVKGTDYTWKPDDIDSENLKGTMRTLDGINGYIALSDGLISRSGGALIDDSATLLLNDQGWLEVRNPDVTDWYFFAYGHDYKAALRDYCSVSGAMPLIPRWILGNWWSRYWHYTQDEFVQLIEDFKSHEIPLSVCIIDMDWHITETGNDSTGWTGYTWNNDLFPDPPALIEYFHEQGLRTAMNLHPADGIHPHEAQYPEMARRMGIDPETKQPVPFDITDPTFVEAYFEVLHHPYEDMGVDFWWIDWQQGLTCNLVNLDPLWFINHLHFQDLKRDKTRRPFIFSRWGNEGHQRYPIGFSGDSYTSWDSLSFQTYMTPTASNVAYGWWSHDIGGHISGMRDSELFTRWVQFGVLSPIMRIHTSKGFLYDQRPWIYESIDAQVVIRDAMQLRHALIPYLYTMAQRAHRESVPLLLPMYYDYPEQEAAYNCPQQYLFGTELIAAPFVTPIDPDTRLARQVVWLPEGSWYNVFTGEHYEGDSWHAIYGALKDIPLFAKAGAILPMGPTTGWGNIDIPDELHLHIFAGADNTFTLYEDDGDTSAYLAGGSATTQITQKWSDGQLDLTISKAEGDLSLLPVDRKVILHFHGVKSSVNISAQVDDRVLAVTSNYDQHTETLTLAAVSHNPASSLNIRLKSESGTLLSHRDRKQETVVRMLRSFNLHSGVGNKVADRLTEILADPEKLAPYLVTMKPSQIRALCETLFEAGVHHISDTHHPELLILWNNRQDEAIKYRYSDNFLIFGMVPSEHYQRDVVSGFLSIVPTILTWKHGVMEEHVQRTQWQLDLDYHGIATVTEAYHEDTP